MSSATAWNVNGVGRETRAFAEEAARRAGMSLGDWLDEVVADKAAEQGVEPDDLERDDRLDAIGERIARLARRDVEADEEVRRRPREDARRKPEPRERDVEETGRRPREDMRRAPEPREPDREEARRAEELLEAAIARLDSRAERAEARAARAFESVAQWIERSQSDRGEERATLKAVADKLATIDQRTARQQALIAETPRRLESRIDEAERELDARMNALSRRLEAVQERPREAPRPPEPPRPPERPRIDIRDAASQIARRRSALDARASTPEAEPPKQNRRNLDVDETPAPAARAPAPSANEPPRPAPAPPSSPSSVEPLRREILALTQRIDQMRRDQSERSAQPVADVQALRAEVAAMSRSLADLAPRNAVVALEGAMRDLSERIAALRDNGVRETLLAPLEALLGQVRDALRAHDPQAAVVGLQREIRAIEAKIDAIAEGVIKPEAFERIRAQTEEVRNLLAAAATRPVPVERLEKQIGELADRVERLAANPSPQAESARVVAMLADARAQIERSTPAAALSAIERRLEELARRMDQALERPQTLQGVEPRAIEELARRIDGVRAMIERQSGAQPDAAKLEAALRELSQKLDRPAAAAASPEALAAMFKDLGARIDRRANPTLDIAPLEQALRALGERPVEIDTAPIENLMRDLGAKLAAPPAIDMRPFEALLGEINQKLDGGAPSATGEIAALIRDLGARIDRGANPTLDIAPLEQALRALGERPVEIDTAPIENLMHDLGDKLAALPAIDMRPFEALLGEINQKLDGGAPSAAATGEIAALIRDLGARIDRSANPTLDIAPLEQALRALGERPVEIDTAPIVNLMRDLGAKLATPPAIDMRPFEALLGEINQKLDRGAPSAAATGEIAVLIRDLGARIDQRLNASINLRPLQDSLHALHDRLDQASTTKIDPALVEQAADLLAERLERRDQARIDADALAAQISDIHDRLDALQTQSPSNAALERKVADLVTELDATRRALQSLPASASRDSDDIADGLADIRAEQMSADKRMQTRLSHLQDILERLVNRLGRVEDEVARVDETARANAFGGTGGAPKASPPARGDAFEAAAAALREIPDRAPARPTRESATSPASAPPPVRAIEGGEFLIEPGANARPRAPEADAAPPKSAVNAHIAAARRAAQAALAENAGKDRRPRLAPEPVDAAEGAPDALAAQAKAFLAARRRPLLLGAALLAMIATFAVVELRGGHPALTQKSELEAPAKITAKPDAPKLGSNGAVGIDTNPVGSIAAPPAPGKNAKPAPAELVASIPAGLPQGLRDAAIAGDVNAEFELGLRLIEGRGVAKDSRAAAQWFEQAAARDLPIAQYRLAALYEKGVGVTRDPQLAISWYTKAATAGNARAMHNLAVMNAEAAAGGKPDYAEAAQWFRKAGQLGVRDSQFNLGILYARGMGVPQDLTQSWVWFSLAAQQGDADAGKKRDEVAAKMDAQALVAAAKALAAFQVSTPAPAANESPTPPGGWDAKTGSAQPSQTPGARAGSTTL